MKKHYELTVIGAGPAGVAAATAAAKHGAKVLLLDEQRGAGGQIYRCVGHSPLLSERILGHDYLRGNRLLRQLESTQLEYVPSASVWNVDADRNLSVLIEDRNVQFTTDKLVICDGAQERPMPIPGWELPGVMTAGAGQILLKSDTLVPKGGVVLAGTGPLLSLLATQYIRAGVAVTGILDTTPTQNLALGFRYVPQSVVACEYFFKAWQMRNTIRRASVPIYKEAASIEARGNEKIESVKFKSSDGYHEIPTELLLLHHGVVPQIHTALAADCKLRWSAAQLCWQVDADQWGQTSSEGIFVAGDNRAIGGARVAELQGHISGLKTAHELGYLTTGQLNIATIPYRLSLRRHMAIRPLIDTLFRPSTDHLLPSDQTIVCRCEEVRAGTIRKIAQQGGQGPNQIKAFSRCGMGPCQGRQCGSTVAALIADAQGKKISEVGYYRVRPPLKPITLGQVGSDS